ncbi:pantothenate synthetase [Dissulfurispira thermophila]|uniref:Pantothenate synthetase n=2 Tax=root TaxID=1 RepID=A0A7G1H1K3_9BACT|nr:pantoate--beta-alanine ligase [Dissulfurispira thermophila]BCB95981.1 pantothenate synthetase [Dissulfurispira thermophila]
MENIRIPRIMRETSKRHLHNGRTIGFVPTMGALHEGHISLIKRAKSENDIVVVSIFVNPTQFGPNEDFDKYPRDLERDMEKLRKEEVHILFMPDVGAMYPEGFSSYITVRGLSDKLCGVFRSGHFTGVATIVCKLFNIVKPTAAYFGQKDFQQAVIIKRMIEDLNMDVNLIICPTVRENDGLAMSSRNVYLSKEERIAATVIFRTLLSASQAIKSGITNPVDVSKHMHDMLMAEPLISEIQYAGVYDVNTFDELNEFKKQNLIAVAVKIGSTRLIDNIIVEF